MPCRAKVARLDSNDETLDAEASEFNDTGNWDFNPKPTLVAAKEEGLFPDMAAAVCRMDDSSDYFRTFCAA